MSELFTLHKDGKLYRPKLGRSHWARRKTYVFVTRTAAEQQADGLDGVEIVRYVPEKKD